MGKYLNLLKSKISKADAIDNPWGLARYLAQKYRAVPPDIPYKELKEAQKSRIKEFYGAVATPSVQNRRGKQNRVSGTSATYGSKSVKRSAGAKRYDTNTTQGKKNLAADKKLADAQHKKWQSEQSEEKSLDVQKFLDFMADDDIPAMNKMITQVDDSPEGLFMQAVRKAMGEHSDQYKDVGKPQFLKKAAKAKPLQKVSNQLAAFLAGLAIDTFDDKGGMTPSQQREWERMVNRQMKRKSLKEGVTMEDLQKHWSDSSDTYVRRVPVTNGVSADETFLDKRLTSPPRAGEVWNPVSHRWTKDGNLGQVNVGSGGKKRFRAGSTSAGAHQKNVGGLSGKGRLRHIGTGRQFRSKLDIAEQAQGTKVGVGSAKGAASTFRTGAKATIKQPTNKTGSGGFKSAPPRGRRRKGKSGKHSNLNVRQVANAGRG